MGLAARACSPRWRQLLADLYIRKYQQSSYKSIMARVLLLAASAVALRPTLPRRSRTTTRAALTMHDYDYDAGSSAYIKLSTAESWPSRHRRDACIRLTD